MSDAFITVLGAKGFIGQHLVAHLQRSGIACFAPQRGDPSVFTRPLGHVVYAMGLTADFRSRPLDTVEAHVCFLRRLLQEAQFESLTYLSSTRVYAGASQTCESARLHVNPNDPSDLYNLSKLMGESLCLHGGHAQMKVARLSNIVGLRPDPDIFIDQLLEEGCRTGQVRLRTALASRKDYLYIDDAVDLLIRIALAPETGIFNVASGEAVRNQSVVDALHSHMGFEVSVQPDAPVWDFTPVDMAKTQARFGFVAQPFARYFPHFLQQYRKKRNLHGLP
ncbi:MAG: NAD(P)-dependent oxidoreductase [Rhodoferax sp.]|uniref:NAD-dependent epimerase/dehydratase family protein n=1 Tax=Rhodoferax sp. TaxID=50421 RepID=UPI003263EE8D